MAPISRIALNPKTLAVFACFCLSASLAQAQTKPADWDKIVEAGRKEGKVVASIPPSSELRKGMEIAFTRRYGIGVEFVPARGGAIVQRMVSEAKSGVHYFDLHIGGTESVVSAMLPENVLEPLEPFFILPEVKDQKQWWGGHIWIDNAKRYIYNFVAYQTVSLWSNPNEYKPAEFKSFDDLLHPGYRGGSASAIRVRPARVPRCGRICSTSRVKSISNGSLRRSSSSLAIFACSRKAWRKAGSRSLPGSAIPSSVLSLRLNFPLLHWPCRKRGFMPAAATATW